MASRESFNLEYYQHQTSYKKEIDFGAVLEIGGFSRQHCEQQKGWQRQDRATKVAS